MKGCRAWQVVDQFLPRRSLWRIPCLLLSAFLGGLTAQLLKPQLLEQRLALDRAPALALCVWTLLVAGSAHVGLILERVPEISGGASLQVVRASESLSRIRVSGSSDSRALLVVLLLAPQLLQLPMALAQGMLGLVILRKHLKSLRT